MITLLDIEQFAPGTEAEALQLKEHIASGAKNVWYVYAWTDSPSGQSWRFDHYQEASDKFDSLPADSHPYLALVTRIGTSVRFRYKEPETT